MTVKPGAFLESHRPLLPEHAGDRKAGEHVKIFENRSILVLFVASDSSAKFAWVLWPFSERGCWRRCLRPTLPALLSARS